VPQLVHQRAGRVQVVRPAHHDVRLASAPGGAERAHALAGVGGAVHPALLQRAAPHRLDVVVAQRGQGACEPVHRRLVRHVRRRGADRRVHVPGAQALQAEVATLELEPAVPHAQVGLVGVQQGVDDAAWHLERGERHRQRVVVAARTGKQVRLARAGREQVRHRALPRQVGVGVALPGALAQRAIGASLQRRDHRLGDGVLHAVRVARRRDVQLGVREQAVGRRRPGERRAERPQQRFDLGAADVRRVALQPLQPALPVGQRRIADPATERVRADRHELGRGERGRLGHVRAQRGQAVGALPRGLVVRVDAGRHRGPDAEAAQVALDPLDRVQPRSEARGAAVQRAREGADFVQAGGDGARGGVERGEILEQGGTVPALVVGHLGAGQSVGHEDPFQGAARPPCRAWYAQRGRRRDGVPASAEMRRAGFPRGMTGRRSMSYRPDVPEIGSERCRATARTTMDVAAGRRDR